MRKPESNFKFSWADDNKVRTKFEWLSEELWARMWCLWSNWIFFSRESTRVHKDRVGLLFIRHAYRSNVNVVLSGRDCRKTGLIHVASKCTPRIKLWRWVHVWNCSFSSGLQLSTLLFGKHRIRFSNSFSSICSMYQLKKTMQSSFLLCNWNS